MSNTFSNNNLTSLPEKTFIGGTYKEFTFEINDSNGRPIDITSASVAWVLSPYGQPESTAIYKKGIYQDSPDKNKFAVFLNSNDTVNLQGKFIQQPIITTASSIEFRPGQGYINILPASGLETGNELYSLSQSVTDLMDYISGSFVELYGAASSASALALESSASVVNFIGNIYDTISGVSASLTNVSGSVVNMNENLTTRKQFYFRALNPNEPVTDAIPLNAFYISPEYYGYKLVDADAVTSGSPVSGDIVVDIKRTSASQGFTQSFLSRKITIDNGKFTSWNSSLSPVIDPLTATLPYQSPADCIYVAVEVQASGSHATGLDVIMVIEKEV